MQWHFSKKRPSDKTRDPVVGEFFSSDAIKDAGEALVREAIQNALDARRDDCETVQVRAFVSGSSGALAPEAAARWFSGAWPHYEAAGNGLRSGDVHRALPCSFLAFEDFGTSGLTGDREQHEERNGHDNPFFYFFRAEAKTAKHGDSRGRWGIGKQVFPRASRAQTFFGYTETSDGGFLMGGCILKHHRVEGHSYKPDGFWGDQRAIADDFLTVPVSSPEELEAFRRDFRLSRRPGDWGLSVVVPWLDDEADETRGSEAFARPALVLGILEGYFVPIMEGRLEAIVEDASGSNRLTRGTYRQVLDSLKSEVDPDKRQDVSRIEALLAVAEQAEAHQCEAFQLEPCAPTKAGWTDTMLGTDAAGQMRQALQDGRTISVTATMTIRPKGGADVVDSFNCYIRRDETLTGRPCHIREDLIISDVKCAKTPGYACIVRVKRGALATLLGDSENPAHTEWQASSRNFKDKYVYGGLAIDFVSSFASEVVRRVNSSSKELDRTLLLDLFSDKGPETLSPATPTGPPRGEAPPQPPAELETPSVGYRIRELPTGFSVTCPDGGLAAGSELLIRAAYETSKGNPFKSYSELDFNFAGSEMTVYTTGADVVSNARNELRVRLRGEPAEIRVVGFDVNRDLQVRVGVSSPEGDADEPVAAAAL
jgi:hypothetical protein